MSRAPAPRRFPPAAGYALSAALHLALFGWAWALPARARHKESVDVQIVETVKPKPVEPEPPKPPEPPKEPVKMRPTRRIALTAPPPETPPPEAPPPETPPPTEPSPTSGPVRLGLSLSSTSVGGGFAAPVGNSLAGRPARRAAAPADDVGPVVAAAALTVQPEGLDTDIPAKDYPKAALDAGFEGQVTLKLLIDASGHVRRATVLKDPGYGLGPAAVKGALKFRYKPGQLNGKPTAVEVTWVVTFELP